MTDDFDSCATEVDTVVRVLEEHRGLRVLVELDTRGVVVVENVVSHECLISFHAKGVHRGDTNVATDLDVPRTAVDGSLVGRVGTEWGDLASLRVDQSV